MNCEDLQALVDTVRERTGLPLVATYPLGNKTGHMIMHLRTGARFGPPNTTKYELYTWLEAWFQGWQEGEKAGSERPINTGN
jgi:hypothetical protein